jgi:alkylation response protein AidB-like acyl-CoA dehydrogenase
MRFALSAEQDQFRQAIRDFLTTHSSPARVREVIDTDHVVDEKLWRRLANDLGVVGLNIPEEFGGTGATFVEVAIAAEELGRALACVPFLSTAVLATSALLESGDLVACGDILPAIAEGRSVLAVALGDGPARTGRPAEPVPAAESVDGQWRVNGELTFVLDGAVADAVLFAADTDGGPSLFLVDSRAAQVESLTGLDLTRRFAHLRFAYAPARLIGTVGDAPAILARVADLGSVAIAADAVGGAESCLDMAVAYAKIREQFGKPIGSFQLTQSKLSWMAADLYRSQLLALHLGRLKEAGSLSPVQVSIAKMTNVRSAIDIARQARTILGASGVTLEYSPIRHANNLEAVLTYEGTEEIHTLAIGQALTGISAYR